jgi:proton-dependent oligopeptide transporter, POT family
MAASIEAAQPAPVLGREAGLFGHPRGLAWIVFTEAWERFSFYGMQALLVLYMAGHLLQPGSIERVIGFAQIRAGIEAVAGPLSTQALASQVFGLYIGLIYLVPILGGLLGDRVLGRRRAVVIGAMLMAAGHFLMVLEPAFVFALLLLIAGSGLLKGNLAAQVGALYAPADQRRDAAFSIYCLGINTGAFIAPLVCGTLGEIYGWHYGFTVAGLGMLVSIVIYLAGSKHLPPDVIPASSGVRARVSKEEVRIVLALLGLLAIAALYWTAQTQVWNVYNLWVRDRVDRGFFDLIVPVTWFQSLDFVAVLLFAPLTLWLWQREAKRNAEPADLTKIAIGCVVFALSCVWLSIAEAFSGGGKISMLWPFVFHFMGACAYLYVGPVMLALISRSAPPSVNAMMVGGYYLSLFLGSIISGWLGRFYEVLSPAGFWLMHAAIVAAGAVVILLLRHPLIRLLQPRAVGRG